jgi:SulP family sulfate permease
VVADNMTKTKHNSNKELVGQGIGNSIAAVFGGIPGAGATIRTVVNIQSGGKTRLSGMIAGILLLFILLALGPIASKIPAAVLSGILITVGIGVMDYKGLKAIPVLPKDVSLGPIKLSSEVLIMLTVLLLSTFWDLIFAVGIGLLISCLMFMKLIGDSTAKRSNLESLKEDAWPDEKGFPVALKDEVYIKHIKGPLFFGYTSEFQEILKKIPNSAKTVVFRLSRMQYMDQTGLYVMEDALKDLRARGINLIFVGLLDQPRYMMERIDIIPGLVNEDQVYENFKMYLKQLSK